MFPNQLFQSFYDDIYIQNAINSRLLTYRCSSDTNTEITTPNCFLRPNVNVGLVLKMDDQDVWLADPPSRSDEIKSIEACDAVLSKFHELWYQDYLLSLREQYRDLHEINFQNKIAVDDVVLVKNPAKTRPFWLLWRVLELIMGDDNKVHSMKVKRNDRSVQIHSIKLLYPQELSLTLAHHPGAVPNSEAAGDKGVDNSVPRKSVCSFHNAPKGIKISRENVTLPIICIYILLKVVLTNKLYLKKKTL